MIGRIEIRHPQTLELAGLGANTLHVVAPDQRLVVFDLGDAIARHSLTDSFVAIDTLAQDASRD